MAGPSLITLHENMLASIDIETTGTQLGYHEVMQIAIIPLDCHLRPCGSPFYSDVRPEFFDRIEPMALRVTGFTVERLENAPSSEHVQDMLFDWFKSQELVPGKRLVPLAQNVSFDMPRIELWLGTDMYNDIFGFPHRDLFSMMARRIDAAGLEGEQITVEQVFGDLFRDTLSMVAERNDEAAYSGKPIPYSKMSLSYLCSYYGIEHDGAHDALADALATATLYRLLLNGS